MADFKAAIVSCVICFALGAGLGSSWGKGTGRQQGREEYRNECVCGDTQTCPFGPGIVGKRVCRTDAFMHNAWGRCEPVGSKP